MKVGNRVQTTYAPGFRGTITKILSTGKIFILVDHTGEIQEVWKNYLIHLPVLVKNKEGYPTAVLVGENRFPIIDGILCTPPSGRKNWDKHQDWLAAQVACKEEKFDEVIICHC